MLSNVDIIREIKKKNIAVSPLSEKTLKGASINLTASTVAWSSGTKEIITPNENNEICIMPHDTAIIMTEELIAVSNKIGGTYHSRVWDVSEGKGHIGTTLNPGWIGHSLIAVHNHTNTEKTIKVGDPFVTVIFEYVATPATIQEDNKPNRDDIVRDLRLNSNPEYNKIADTHLVFKEFMECYLKKGSDDYKAYLKHYEAIIAKDRFKKFMHKNGREIVFTATLLAIYFFINYLSQKYSWNIADFLKIYLGAIIAFAITVLRKIFLGSDFV